LQAGALQNSQPPTPDEKALGRRSSLHKHERENSEVLQRILAWRVGAEFNPLRKTMHKQSPPEEHLKLAEVCLHEAERTLDREVADMLLLRAGRYLDEAKRLMATHSFP
jgi:hypothetical protein